MYRSRLTIPSSARLRRQKKAPHQKPARKPANANPTMERALRTWAQSQVCFSGRRNFRGDSKRDWAQYGSSRGESMAITRRVFLRNGGLAVIGTAAVPSFLTRAAFGAVEPSARNKRLVVIFQRGAADGLNILVPHGEPQYYAMRPSINIPRKAVLDLDGFFGLHPSLAAFQPLWRQRHLAIVHAAGSPDPTRSHFDAQDFMESGTP